MVAHLLVTGGAGFVGANFVAHWRGTHPADRVVILDALTPAANLANLGELDGITLVHGDIRNAALVRDVLREFAIDTIVHFAAECDDDPALGDDDRFVSTNVLGTYTLLGEAKTAWLDGACAQPHHFHQVSTREACVGTAPGALAAPEHDRPAPATPYAASKTAADHLVRAYHQAFGLQASISHGASTFGPRQAPGKPIPTLLIDAIEGRTLPIDGTCTRTCDWLHVGDHCRGIERALADGQGRCCHPEGKSGVATFELVDLLCATVDDAFAADPDLACRFPGAPAAQGEPTAVLKRFLDEPPAQRGRFARDGAHSDNRGAAELATHLRATVRWYLDNEAWWRATLAQGSAMPGAAIGSRAA